MRLNKKLFCFLFVMFITLICCCAVSAVDDSDMETTATATATTSNDVVKDVESTSNVHSNEVTGSTDDTLQSDNNNEEAVNQNGVLDQNNNLNKVEKTKVSNRAVKTAATYTGPEFWDLAQDGVINLTEDVTITSTVVLHSNLTVNGNGYTITSQGNHDLFEAHGPSESVYHSLTLYDLKVTGVPQNGTSKGFYVVDHGYEHVFIECEFIDNAGIYVEPAKTHDKTALTMINCYVSGCKGYAFDVPTQGTQRRRFNVYNCVFEENENPIFNLFQHSEFYGYNFLINDMLVSNNDTFVGQHNDPTKPISVQQAIDIKIIAYQCESNITIDCEPKVYIDEPNNITIRLLVTLYLEHLNENITLGAPSENVTLEVKYEDGSIQELYGTIGTDGTVKNLTDHTGRTFNWVAGEKTGIVNVTAVFDGSRFLVDGKHLYNSSSAKTTFEIVQIPTTTVVNDVTGKVGLPTKVNATVTNDSEIVGNDDPVPQGTVSFYYNDTIFLGNATVNNGFAEITGIVFNHTVDAELIKAKYHDENGKYSDSSDTANIKILPGEAVMEATPNPDSGVPGVNSTVTISVTDKNTNTLLPNGTVNVADSQTGEIIIRDVEIINGEGSFLYNITKDTLLSGTTLNLTFSSADYEDAKTQVTITRELIPTVTVVNPVNDTVYSPVTITANVTNNSGNLPVNQGNVTFTYNDNVIGTAQVSNGQASISYVFEEIVEDGVIYAQYVDNNEGEARIFEDSEGSNENTGKTNIGKREAKITATPEPASGIPGVTSTVTITVTDVKDSNIKINGTVTIDDLNDTSKTFDPIEISEGEGIFDYSIIDTTLLTGNTLNFTFKDNKGNYDDVDTTATIARLLIPTATVVDPVTGMVGVSTPVTAKVTTIDADGRIVDNGTVTFTYNDTVIGTATISNGEAVIYVVFNHTIDNGIITASYADDREGESKIFEDSEGSNENTGKTVIDKGVANISAVAVPIHDIPGKTSVVNITVWDNNTGLPISGTVVIDGTSVTIGKDGKGSYDYLITDATSRDGTKLIATFTSPDYDSVSDDVTITRELIPTVTVVDPVRGTVGTDTVVSANVTSVGADGRTVDKGTVTFTFDGKVIGTAIINNGKANISVVFNHTIDNGIITASYVDDREGESKIFEDSEGSNENTGKTVIDKGVANITAEPDTSGIPGMNVVVTFNVKDNNTGLPISGTVVIDGTSVTIGKDGKGSYDYLITDATSRDGTKLIATFTSPDYDSVSDDVTITRELIPTVTVVSPVNGKVGISTPVTATVTSSNGRVVDAGEVTFTYNGTVIGTAVVSDGSASIDVIFNHSVVDDIVTATYVDVREGEYKIFNTSSSSTDIEKSGKTNIEQGVANITAEPDTRGIPGMDVTVTINVKDNNTGLPITGSVSIDGTTVTIGADGKGTYNYPITTGTSRDGSVLTAVFSSPDYESVSDDVTIGRDLIPTSIVVDSVTGTVGVPTTVTAVVTSSNDMIVSQGKVTFTFDGKVIGTAIVNDGVATISVVFNNSVTDGLTTADYVDDNVGDAKIFDISSSSTDIDESGRTNIVPGEAVIVAVANPDSGIPGVISVVDITVTDKNTGLPINGTVTIDGSTVDIIDGKGSYNYPITVDTSRDGSVLTAVFSSPDYNEVNDTVTVSRELIPTSIVVDPVTGTVGVPVTVTAVVTSSNGRTVTQGKVSFTFDGKVIGTAIVNDGVATISVVFNNSVTDGLTTADYVDDNVGDAKIFDISSSSTDIDESGRTNIVPGQAVISVVAVPDKGIPGVTSVVTITVTDKNTGLPIDGDVSIDGTTVPVAGGTAIYDYGIVDSTLRAGTVLTAEFSSPDYESVSADVTVYRLLIPTAIVVEPVNGVVGIPTTITAVVTSSNGRPVTQGIVTFAYNGQVIGVADVTIAGDESVSDVKMASPGDATASISVVFNNSIKDGLITADYIDDNVGEAKIFDDSSSSTDIDESGRTNIVPGEAVIVAVANPVKDIPGVISVVDITVTDKNTGLPINGTVTIDGSTVDIIDGEGSYDYLITDDTSRDGSVLTAVFSSPDYESVSDDVTISRELIPTTTVVSPVTGSVGSPVTVTAVVTSSNGRTVTQGKVSFTFDGKVIGTATISNGIASISVVFNNSITDGLTTADYVDDNVGDAKIFDISSSSTDIDESGRTNIVPGQASIDATPIPASGIPGVISVVDITVTDANTGLPINGIVSIDGTNVTIVDGKGSYNYPITVDTSRDGSVLTAVFSSPDYESVSDDVTITREIIPTNTNATVINNTAGNVIIKVNVTDEINNEPVPNGTVEVYVNDTLVGKGEIVDGVVDIVTGITEVGTYDITVKYTGNDVYTDSEDVLEDVEVVSLEPRIIKIGFWKLVCFNVTPEKNTTNYTKPSKVNKPAIRYKAHRTTKFTGSSKYYRAVNNYRHYKPSWKKSSSRPIIIPPMSKLQYRLFIALYADVMEGDMSFADFVAILKLNGIEVATLNSWNENGEIIIDYDNLEEVPDSIEIVDNGGHLEDYSQSINKNNAPDNDGVIDSGDVEVKSKASNTESSNAPSTSGSHASSSNAGSSGDSEVAAASGE